MASWKDSPITRRYDGTFVVDNGGYPYHVTPATDAELYTQVSAYATDHPDQVTDEPIHPSQTEEGKLASAKAVKLAELDAADRELSIAMIQPLVSLVTEPQPVSDVSPAQAALDALKASLQANREAKQRVDEATTVDEVEAVPVETVPVTE